MIVGLDLGSSAAKVVCLEHGEFRTAHYELNSGRAASEIVTGALAESGIALTAVSGIVATGLGSEFCDIDSLGIPVKRMVELPAVGRGATWLAGIDRAVIANFGTGTSFVKADGGRFTHLGGTGVGGGTLVGLGRRILGVDDPVAISQMAKKGDIRRIDLSVGDLATGGGSLPADLTASNLAKATSASSDEDWAAGILNLIMQVVGSMSVLCCSGNGLDTVIITGGTASLPDARWCYESFERLYGYKFILPEHGRFATAVGAVLYGESEKWD